MNENNINDYTLKEYRRWLEMTEDNIAFNKELRDMEFDPEQIADAFYTEMKFGTSGLRGVIGPGTNRMNEYTVRRATQGLANYMNKTYNKPSFIIAYDTRKYSKFFALETAKVLMANNIDVRIFADVTPVSVLSYAIPRLGCTMGVIITASHNPKIFNGYKVYNEYGYQIVGTEADLISEEIGRLDYFDIRSDISDNEVKYADSSICSSFVETITDFAPLKKNCGFNMNDLSVVYTPLNGTGNRYVREVLKNTGFDNLTVVPVQEHPDENFTTCPAPNPEKITSYAEAFKILDKVKGDIIIATDPDSDRIGVALYYDDVKTLLTGNQLGVLMLDFLCTVSRPSEGQITIKSIVTTPLIDRIAAKYGLKVINTLTGFKYIGEIVTSLEKQGQKDRYYFGFEESNGYLMNPFIRDKDGVSGAMLAVQMAAYYKHRGLNLIDRLYEIYDEYGACYDKVRNYYFEGAYGYAVMKSIMNCFRNHISDSIGKWRIIEKIDYLSDTDLPKEDMLSFKLENGAQFLIRPSGTESKIKVYFFELEPSSELENYIKSIISNFKTI